MVIYGSLLILSRNNTKDNRIRPTRSIINSCWIMSGRIEGGTGEWEISSLEFSHPNIVGMLSPFRGDDKEEGAIRRHSGASSSMTLGVDGGFFSFLLVLLLHRDAAQLDKWKLMMKRKELLLGNTTLSPWLSSRLSRPSPCRRSPGHQHKNLV